MTFRMFGGSDARLRLMLLSLGPVECRRLIGALLHEHVLLPDERVQMAIGHIGNGTPVPSSLTDELFMKSTSLDEEYFAIQESGAGIEQWWPKFAAARFFYAVALATQGLPAETVLNVVYEIGHSTADPEAFFQQLAETLASQVQGE